MHFARAVVSVAFAAPLIAAVSGCPSLDGFVRDAGDEPDAAEAGPPSGGFLGLEDAARYCSKALTCPNLGKSTQISIDVPIDEKSFAACVAWLTNTVPPDRPGMTQAHRVLECAAQATSCTAASGCNWFEFISGNDPRCVGYSGGQFGACSPNLSAAYQCNYGFIAHCDDPFNYSGSSCLQGNAGYYFCAVSSGLCSADGGGVASSCSGSFYEYCNEGLLVGYDCNVQGMTCGKDPVTQEYGCLANGKNKTCGTAGQVSCSGDTVEVCDGLTQSEINCASNQGTCDSSGAVPRCTVPNETCSPYDADENVCTGDSISLCVGGAPLSFDCTTIGLHCVAGTTQASAHCG